MEERTKHNTGEDDILSEKEKIKVPAAGATAESILAQMESNKNAANEAVDQLYGTMDESGKWSGGLIGELDAFYEGQKTAASDWEKKQTELQNQQTDFAIEKIEQQKAQAKEDYIKEQSGAYTDWQKQSNPYGANAEAMASTGLRGSGYAESSKVSMYNTWQNRVAVARQSYERAVLNYNNAMTEARLQNSVALAEIAYETFQKQLELSITGFQHKNSLIFEAANLKKQNENTYIEQYLALLEALKEEEKNAATSPGTVGELFGNGASGVDITKDTTAGIRALEK